MGDTLKNSSPGLSRNVKVLESKESLRNGPTPEQLEGDVTTRCDVVSWVGSWNRTKTQEKLRKSRTVWSMLITYQSGSSFVTHVPRECKTLIGGETGCGI